jgi:hypothetical protein
MSDVDKNMPAQPMFVRCTNAPWYYYDLSSLDILGKYIRQMRERFEQELQEIERRRPRQADSTKWR